MKQLLAITFTLITTISLAQKGRDIDNYSKAEIKIELEKMKAKHPQMLALINGEEPDTDNLPKEYSKDEEKIVSRYKNADNCKVVFLSKNTDSVNFYGKPIKLLSINKNRVVFTLPHSLLVNVESFQAENKDGNFLSYFDKNETVIYHPKRITLFKQMSAKVIEILDNFEKLSEQEIKDILKKEAAKTKTLPKTHQDRIYKIFLYFNGNPENLILYIKDN